MVSSKGGRQNIVGTTVGGWKLMKQEMNLPLQISACSCAVPAEKEEAKCDGMMYHAGMWTQLVYGVPRWRRTWESDGVIHGA